MRGMHPAMCVAMSSDDARAGLTQIACFFEPEELSWPVSAVSGASAMLPVDVGRDVLESLRDEALAPKRIRTVAIVKTEARAQIHKILKYVRRGGLDIVGMRMLQLTTEEGEEISRASGVEWTQTGRVCVALLLEREDAVSSWARLCGNPDPAKAKRENEFSIRAIFGTSPTANAVHASTTLKAAMLEEQLLFPARPPKAADPICGSRTRKAAAKQGSAGGKLCEIVVVVAAGGVLKDEEHATVVEGLIAEDFRIVNCRLTHLGLAQSDALGVLFGQKDGSRLRDGPVLLVAAERDSGVSRLQAALGRAGGNLFRPGGGGGLADLVGRYPGCVLGSDTSARALQQAAYCFDALHESTFVIS